VTGSGRSLRSRVRMAGVLAALVTSMVAVLTPGTASAAAATHDLFLWPFSSTSPWNTPVGSGVQFAPATDARNRDLLAVRDVNINARYYSQTVYQARSSDPVRTVTDASGPTTYRVPDRATPARGSDADMNVIDPSKQWVDECWRARRHRSGDWTCGYHVRNDLSGSGVSNGVRAAGVSAIGGLIRRWELNSGQIHHALALAVPRRREKVGWVWPANYEDRDSAGTYRGHIRMGSLFAIPRSVDVTGLGLSSDGLVLARALQHYGAYAVESTDSVIAFYAEPSADGDQSLTQMSQDASTIRNQLRVVTNNSATSIGGGGTYPQKLRPPPAPTLAAPRPFAPSTAGGAAGRVPLSTDRGAGDGRTRPFLDGRAEASPALSRQS
jgi:hypothetical protein